MEKDSIAQAARISADMTTAGFDLWRQVLEQLREQQQDAARQMLAGHRQLGEADRGATSPDWQAYCQDNLQRSIELSSGAWDAFYSTQRNLLQVCQKMAGEQSRLLEEGLSLAFGVEVTSEPARLEASDLDAVTNAASVDQADRQQ